MIGLLRGKVVERKSDTLIIDVNGVGYSATVTHGALSVLKDTQQQIVLTIYTDVKENSITLFGFQNSAEKEVFLLLKKVKGIGSKLALSIVSALGAEGVLLLIGQGDITRLKQVPGIGAKTAERIVVELRESVVDLLEDIAPAEKLTLEKTRVARPGAGVEYDVVLALEKLGFAPDRARQVVTTTMAQSAASGIADPGQLLRLALSNISGA